MSFLEIRFPEDISTGAKGGPGYSTEVVVTASGYEKRNARWQEARHTYDVAYGLRIQAELDTLIAFFRQVKGKAYGFRFKDWADFKAADGEGALTDLGGGKYQMYKKYEISAGLDDYRKITKPVEGSIDIIGGTADIDYTSGIITATSGSPLTWTGEFDVPCRFDMDEMQPTYQSNYYTWESIPIVEIRL